MPPETLHINWLQGQLTVQKNRAQTGQEVWTSPEKISSKDDLLEAIGKAASALSFTGKDLYLTIEHDALSYQTLQTPQLNDKLRKKFLHHKANDLKEGSEGTCIAYSSLRPSASEVEKKVESVILCAAEGRWLQDLILSIESLNFQVRAMTPGLGLAYKLLTETTLSHQRPALMVCVVQETALIAAGDDNGILWLFRKTKIQPEKRLDHLEKTIRMTIGYIQDHFQHSLDLCVLRGLTHAEQEALSERLPLPCPDLQQGQNTLCGAWEDSTGNPLPSCLHFSRPTLPRHTRPSRWKSLLTCWAGIQVAAACLVAALLIGIKWKSQDRISTIEQQINRMSQLKKKLQNLDHHLSQKRFWTETMADEIEGSLPLWFLAYMSTATPSSAILDHFHIQQTNNAWAFRIEGSCQLQSVSKPAERIAHFKAVEQNLTMALTGAPFHASLKREPGFSAPSAGTQHAKGSQSPSIKSFHHLGIQATSDHSKAPWYLDAATTSFQLEGIIQ